MHILYYIYICTNIFIHFSSVFFYLVGIATVALLAPLFAYLHM